MKLDLPKHWDDFLKAVDKALEEPVCLHCIGGFVVETVYGIPRRTGDLDYLTVDPIGAAGILEKIAGQQSELAKNHGLYFQHVTVADYPDNYDDRLTELELGLNKLQLFVLDPYDLILSKLTRNIERDRDDVKALAVVQQLSFEVLKKRHEEEMDWLPNPKIHALTLKLWKEYFPS
jgi:hypothetical protein